MWSRWSKKRRRMSTPRPAQRLEQKVVQEGMDLQDFSDRVEANASMGPMKQVLGLLPGINAKRCRCVRLDDTPESMSKPIVLSMDPAVSAPIPAFEWIAKRGIAKGPDGPCRSESPAGTVPADEKNEAVHQKDVAAMATRIRLRGRAEVSRTSAFVIGGLEIAPRWALRGGDRHYNLAQIRSDQRNARRRAWLEKGALPTIRWFAPQRRPAY